MHWLERVFRAFSQIFFNGALQPTRSGLNFTGAGVTVTDNPAQDRLDVEITIPSSAALDGATASATPNTIVQRNALGAASFAGQCQFAALNADDVECGTLTVNAGADITGGLSLEGSAQMTGILSCFEARSSGNISLGSLSPSYGSGVGVVYLASATTPPSGSIAGGGVLYLEGSNLYLRVGTTRYNLSKVIS